MELTKEEALERFKNALNRKKAWEEKFEAKYAEESQGRFSWPTIQQ